MEMTIHLNNYRSSFKVILFLGLSAPVLSSSAISASSASGRIPGLYLIKNKLKLDCQQLNDAKLIYKIKKYLLTGIPFGSTRNFSKFHEIFLTESVDVPSPSYAFNLLYKGAAPPPFTSILSKMGNSTLN